MSPLESFVTANLDALTFGVFFGCLFVLGLMELRLARQPNAAHRARRWPANTVLTVLNLMVFGALPVSGVIVAQLAAEADFGLFHQFELPFAALLGLGFLARSLISYIIHLAMHKVPLLWRIHRIHHTDTALDVTTTVRFHPLEFVISMPLVVATIWSLGIPPIVIMLYEIFDAAMAVFSHANLRLPARLERIVQLALVTPAMHRVHHSSRQPETDSNYGATLSLWDRMFGTYNARSNEDLEAMQLGLAECQDTRSSSLLWLLALPFRSLKAQQTGKHANTSHPNAPIAPHDA